MARIFIAIRFDDEVKKALVGLQDTLKAKGVKGNYCPYRNLHMTLAFIGETYDLSEISKAVSEVKFGPSLCHWASSAPFLRDPALSGVA